MVLDRSERVLGKPLTQLPFLLVLSNSPLHFIEQVFIHPTGDATTAFAACALSLDRTMSTGAGRVVLDIPALLRGLEAEGQLLSCRAPIAIAFSRAAIKARYSA